MMRRQSLSLALAVLVLTGCEQIPDQPIEFSHAVHAGQKGIGCLFCHPGASQSARAGLPPFVHCLQCHMRPQGTSPNPREQRVRQLAAEAKPQYWRQITRNPGHVYFSHRAHVVGADMSCTHCHGEVRKWTAPPKQPTAALVSMASCMNCHRSRGASNECQTCHR